MACINIDYSIIKKESFVRFLFIIYIYVYKIKTIK